MKQENTQHEKKEQSGKKPKEDLLKIVRQFIGYFEEADRGEQDGDRIKSSKCL